MHAPTFKCPSQPSSPSTPPSTSALLRSTKFAAVGAAALLLSACAPTNGQGPVTITAPQIDPQTRTTQGAALGAVIGGIAGATRGDDANDRHQNAAVGALAGAAVGGVAGNLLDRQAQQLNQDLQGSGVTVARTNNSITLNLPGDITFPSNSSAVSPQFQPTIDRIAQTLVQYPDTRVQITGHTDNTGSFQYNQQLSQARAQSVASQLAARGVQFNRITTAGASFSNPIADNSTEFGRQQNRRVDIVITPTQ